MRIEKGIIWRIVCLELQNGHMKTDSNLTMTRQRNKVNSREIGIDGIKVGVADEIKYVGMWLNHSLTMRNWWQQCAVWFPEIYH